MSRLRFFLLVECPFYTVLTSKSLKIKKKQINPYGVQNFSYGEILSSITWDRQVRVYFFLWLMQYFVFPIKERLSIRIQSGLHMIYRYHNIIIVPGAKLEEMAWFWNKGSIFAVSKLWLTNYLYRLKKRNIDFSKNVSRDFSDHREVCWSVKVLSTL